MTVKSAQIVVEPGDETELVEIDSPKTSIVEDPTNSLKGSDESALTRNNEPRPITEPETDVMLTDVRVGGVKSIET